MEAGKDRSPLRAWLSCSRPVEQQQSAWGDLGAVAMVTPQRAQGRVPHPRQDFIRDRAARDCKPQITS